VKVAVVSTALGPGNIFTTPPLFYGGLEEVAALRARHLLEQGHRFTCLPLRAAREPGGPGGQAPQSQSS